VLAAGSAVPNVLDGVAVLFVLPVEFIAAV
jgi:hypothetical protein